MTDSLDAAINVARISDSTVRPFNTLAEQAAAVREFSRNPQQRVRTGLPTLDSYIEGPAAGEVYTVLGRSFAGKSMFGLNIVANNPQLGSIFFSLEMPARMAVQRMYCMVTGVEYSDLHRQITAGSLPESFEGFAAKMPYAVIIDHNDTSLESMANYVDSYEAYYGFRPAFTVMDYMELIGGAKASGEGMLRIEAVAGMVKSWAKDNDMPVWLLHQTNRSEKQYDPPTRDSARYGGYTEADVMIGMWQRGEDPDLSEFDRDRERGRVYFNVLKNRVTGQFPRREIETLLQPNLAFADLQALEKKARLL